MKKRIAFISEHASPLATLGGVDSGGQNVYVDKLTKQLALLGYSVDIFTRWENPQMPQIVDCHNGIRVIHVEAGPVTYIRKEDILSYMNDFTEWMVDFITQEKIEYQLIHANFFMSGLVAADIKQRLGIPFVIIYHALGKVRRVHQGKSDAFADERFAIEERIAREADQIIAECPQDKEDLIIHYHANQDKITIVPCGFDPNEFYPIDKRLAKMTLGLNPDEKYILQLGRMVPRKGVDNVIRGVAEMVKHTSIPVKLLIVGGDSDIADATITPEIGRLQALAATLNIADNVVFVGRKNREQLKYYYNAADVFVSTPWYEPFGITPLEAMACGTPVIGSNVGGIKFTVKHGKTGFLVEPNDAGELGTCRLAEILQDEKLYHSFREQAIKRVNAFFSWSTIATSMAALYEKVLVSVEVEGDEYKEMHAIVDTNFSALIATLQQTQESLHSAMIIAAQVMIRTLNDGGKILVCGNGGSASDAQHFAGELAGHFLLDNRPALPIMSLTADTTLLTAISNDYSFKEVFARQVEAYGKSGDILVAISTSGNSENVIQAVHTARQKNMFVIGLTGKDGGALLDISDIPLVIPSNNVQHIQEVHTHIIHTLCELVEKTLFAEQTYHPMVGMKFGKSKKSIALTSQRKEGKK